MPRKSTGKRLRFEVFKRDHFTCQYCGAQPPDVVLVVDHITPVADGGGTTIDNLITACEACNQGKAHLPITTRQVRPDADLLYLETQQEIAELRRYQEAKAQREAVLMEIIEGLQDQWLQYSGRDWSPSDRIVRQLLSRYSPEIVEAAMLDVAIKIGTGYLNIYSSSNTRWIGYLYKVAATMNSESEDEDDY
jgi:hypothetical protein